MPKRGMRNMRIGWTRAGLTVICATLSLASAAFASYRGSPASPYRPDVSKIVVGAISGSVVASPANAEVAPPPPRAQDGMKSQPPPRRLEPSDEIAISLHVSAANSGRIEDVIDELGFVNLPLLNRIKLGGLTTTEAEDFIEKRYVDEKFYRFINVAVVATARSYYIEGHVLRPGKYELSPGLTVSQAIAATGGMTPFGNEKKIRLIRRGRDGRISEIKVHLPRIRETRDPDLQLESGDVLKVPRKLW